MTSEDSDQSALKLLLSCCLKTHNVAYSKFCIDGGSVVKQPLATLNLNDWRKIICLRKSEVSI